MNMANVFEHNDTLFVPIDGKETELARDHASMGVAATDYRKALNAKERIREAKEKLRLEQEEKREQKATINRLETEVSEIKNMMSELFARLDKVI